MITAKGSIFFAVLTFNEDNTFLLSLRVTIIFPVAEMKVMLKMFSTAGKIVFQLCLP